MYPLQVLKADGADDYSLVQIDVTTGALEALYDLNDDDSVDGFHEVLEACDRWWTNVPIEEIVVFFFWGGKHPTSRKRTLSRTPCLSEPAA